MKEGFDYWFFDMLVFLPLVWGAYKGYASGVLSEVVGIIHFAIAFVISFRIVGLALSFTDQYIFNFNKDLYAEVAIAVIVGLSFFLLSTAGKFLKTEIDYDFPGAWDNLIGGVVGVAKYAVLISFFFWFISGFGKVIDPIKRESLSYQALENIAFTLVGVQDDQALSDAIKRAL